MGCGYASAIYTARLFARSPVVTPNNKEGLVAIETQWVLDDGHLASLCAEWRQLPYVAVDTEFMRVDTFYPIAALLQVGDGRCAYLIDPLLINDWTAFAGLLADQSVVKVLHACSEDLEVLWRLTGSLPTPLFDTQLAAGYLNIGFSMGYSRLVQSVLNIELPKGETRSDWLQRPLSEMQVRYAAEDAQHLAELYEALLPKLSDEKRDWVLEDGSELVANLQRETDPDEAYREVKQAWRLKPRQLAVLRALTAWREQQARARNQPRNRVLREHSLWPLARTQPSDLVSLARIDDMHPRTVRQDGETLLELIRTAAATPEDNWPEALPEPLPLEASALLKKLRAVGQRESQTLDIAPELMLRKKTLEALLKSGYPDGPYELPDSLRGWRRERMGQALLDVLEEK
jgi:ribonuclease D